MSKNRIAENNHVCPWWLAFTFDNPVRKLIHNPEKIMGDLIQAGDVALDIGCGMGYFTIGMAPMVGENGKVIAVDLQAEMLAGVQKRAQRHGVAERIQLHRATTSSIGLAQSADFALAFWMVHEVPNKESFLREIKELLRPGGRFLFVEPKIHVNEKAIQETVTIAEKVGFILVEERKVAFSRAVLFTVS